ncbi:hypothetical protein QFC21_001561 [Naganishia friedmannii]|uniref:Uncharacterized protein n=1 Tax=Naganishia friedmannii TaxID=89922 RepID=A0ACC2W515_9TREE|nr:hypothetical protein QFC21_001561 [Naganishia friedmannii]
MPGHLHVATDAESLSENRWIPLVDGCETPRLFDSFVAAMNKESSDEKTDVTGKREWKRKQEDVEWARNRTVVLFGDSVLRENIAYFCEMVGAELHRVTWSHAFAPRPRPKQPVPPLHPAFTLSSSIYTTFPPPADPDADPDLATAWTPKRDLGEGDQSHLAHYCYVEEMGFLLVQQFQYGSVEADDGGWRKEPGYIPPGTFEDRLHTLLLPIVDKAIVSHHHPDLAITGAVSNTEKGRKAPALIMLNSAFWDTARWVREDMRFGRDTDGALSSERLRWYKTRVRQAVLSVAEVYPDSAISWMTHHYPTGSGPSDWFTSGIEVASQQQSNDAARNGKAPATRPGNTVLRLTELDSVVRAALQYPDDDSHDPTCNARSETGEQQDDDDMNDGWTHIIAPPLGSATTNDKHYSTFE